MEKAVHPAGYSGTPLAKKLGIGASCRVVALGAPANYRELLEPLPATVHFQRAPGADTDVVHFFTRSRAKLAQALPALLAKLRPDAAIWVSWPKQSAGVATDVTEGTIRDVALPLGLVDVKVCAVDATWSGLKLVLRKENRVR
jgi:hypothetical protein